MEQKRIAIIGCGNLGTALLRGLLDGQKYEPKNITATKRNVSALATFEEAGVNVTSNNAAAIAASDIVLVALKPHHILEELQHLQSSFREGKHVLVSLATGVSIAQLEAAIGIDIPVFRAMPNTAADVNQSLTCICSSSNDEAIYQQVEGLFTDIGKIQRIEEKLMEAATVLGACGIAFVLRFIRAMVQGGIQIGFDAKTASFIVNQTVNGASQLLLQNNSHPEQEIDKVTTPKGCTIEGLNEMEHNGFSSALIKGIVSSFEKIEK
ncbi:MAG: pyrroline-5-carboxylate reductase [Bacteroidota bacterium]